MTVRDRGEILDLVIRKGPISVRGIMRQQSAYSRDHVYRALSELEDEGAVRSFEGDLHEHGTTRSLYEARDDPWEAIE